MKYNKDKAREKWLSENKNYKYKVDYTYESKNAIGIRIWREKNPEKIKAHRLVFSAIRNKSLTKEPCLICGDLKSEAHHTDYSKPLVVVWLCKTHHIEEDRKRRKEENGL